MEALNDEMQDFSDEVVRLTKKFKSLVGTRAFVPEPEPVPVDEYGRPIVTYQNVMHCDVPGCNDTGSIVKKDEDGYMYAVPCVCDAQRKALIALRKSGLEDSLKLFTFENFKCDRDYRRQMYDMCERFVEQDERKFLYLSGQSGCGKTHLGTAISGHYMKQGVGVIYTTFKVLMNDLKSNLNDEEYGEVLRKYGTVPVLYIDDFMKPYEVTNQRTGRKELSEPTKSDVDNSFEVLNMRVLKKLVTIITTERSLDDVIRIDEALGSRIKKCCGEFVMEIAKKEGRNYRLFEQSNEPMPWDKE